MPSKLKNPNGRPTKFSKKSAEIALTMAEQGSTDDQISAVLKITKQTLNNWKKKHPKFFDSLKSKKLEADNRVTKSLYERANGYSHPEVKVQWVNGDDGGQFETLDLIKHYPPDTTACIFWLKNRQPDKWREKQ